MSKKYIPLFEEFQELQHINETSVGKRARALQAAEMKYGSAAENMYPNILRNTADNTKIYDDMNIRIAGVPKRDDGIVYVIIDKNNGDEQYTIEANLSGDTLYFTGRPVDITNLLSLNRKAAVALANDLGDSLGLTITYKNLMRLLGTGQLSASGRYYAELDELDGFEERERRRNQDKGTF